MERPNFERITQAIMQWRWLRDEIIREELVKEWEKISKRESEYPEIKLLEDLLKEYEMEIFLPDFLLIGFHFIEKIKVHEKHRHEKFSGMLAREPEFFQALNFLLTENENVKIEIYKKNSQQVSIQDPFLISKIKEGLLDTLERGYSNIYYWDYPLDIKRDWKKFIKGRLERKKNDSPKKGRPNEIKPVKPMVFSLWYYLQNNTELKADKGKYYSRRQARFIFSFLEIHKLIDQSMINKEDVIAYYLKSFTKSSSENLQRMSANYKARDLIKEKSDIEEFLSKHQKDFRLTSKRKEDLLKRIGYLEKNIDKRNEL